MKHPTSTTVPTMAIVIVVALAASSCQGARTEQFLQALASAQEQVGNSFSEAADAAIFEAQELALRAAVDSFHGQLSQVGTDPDELRRQAFVSAVGAGNRARAESLLDGWELDESDLELVTARIRLHVLAEEFETAQAQAWGAVERFEEQRPEMVELWYETWAADPDFAGGVRTIRPGDGADSIQHLDRGTSLNFTFRNDGDTSHAFKPRQTLHLSSYRGELASWRLCAFMHCVISMPFTEEVRISEADFLELTGLTSADEIPTAFVREHSELIWWEDDEGTRWLYGVSKAWVPGFIRYPIESYEVWMDYTRVGRDVGVLRRTSFEDMVTPVQLIDPERYLRILDRGRDLSAYDFAHQISDLHVFDLLTNNWDRYRMNNQGANCQFDHGQFVSIDNGATWQLNEEDHAFRGVQYRIDRVQVFSRRTIDAIRWMQPDALFPILFPDGPHSEGDAERWEYFLQRRQWLLDYVDGLVETHGEEAVYIFE